MGRKLDDMSHEELKRTIAAGGLRRDRLEKAKMLLALHEDGHLARRQNTKEGRAEKALRLARSANLISLAAAAVALVALLVTYLDGS